MAAKHIMNWIYLLIFTTIMIQGLEIEQVEDDFQEYEEIECETVPETDLLRNGLGDDSYYLWSDKKIPYVIGNVQLFSKLYRF